VAFSDAFLEDLRGRVPVSEVATRAGLKLTRAGAEFKALSPFNDEKTPSFTVNDQKRLFACFSSGKSGDVFKFLMETKGLSFPDSVKEIAAIAGVALPNGEYKANGSYAPASSAAPAEKKERAQPVLVATYDYEDNDKILQYQVCRFEPKTFRQRRPAPGRPGAWIWGLDAGEYVKHDRYPDFYAATSDRTPEKGWNVRIKVDEAVTHGLFNFPEIMEEMRQEEDDRRIVAIAEGERDCLTLAEMGVLATTNSGGAKHWQPHLAEYLRGADVVVLLDNDKPGRERGEMIARTLYGVARRIRVLDWKIYWPEVPDKGDVTDWRDRAGGTKEKLYEIVGKLAPWSPAPYKSDFGAVTWSELSVRAQSYAFLIQGVLPTRERAMMYGAPESGKSFAAMDMSLSIARGIPYEGRRVQQSGVIYCSWEGGRGFPNRVEGYRQWHGLEVTDGIPFVMLTRAADLFGDEEVMKKLQVEIEHWAKVFLTMGIPLGLVVFDTVSASGGVMDENHGSDVAKYLNNGRVIAESFNCTILYVHHIPKNGTTPRGSGKFTADLETTFSVHPDKDGACDDNGRPIKVLRLGKQREGEGNKDIKRFVLRQMEIGRDEYDQPMTTCILLPPGGDAKAASKRGFHPTPQESKVFRALLDALNRHGAAPDVSMEVPTTIERVVTYAQWRDAYAEIDIAGDEEESTRAARIKTAMKRGGESLMKFKIIGKKEFDARNKIFWHTGEPVRGFPETFKKQETYRRPVDPEPMSLSAPGDDEF
jgi:hypothetical protein